eukprot:m.306204 g.306204  ORF g.306204 m.306204 type:complete len:246 (+) comp41041_c0_seq1:819-1556(+)
MTQVKNYRDLEALALKYEKETEAEGWTLLSRNAEEEFLYRSEDDSTKPSMYAKCRLRLNNVPLKKAIRMIADPKSRNAWDGDHFTMEKLGEKDGLMTIHWKLHFPACFKDRDMVQLASVRRLDGQNAYVILYTEGSHDRCPPTRRYVRMTTGFSCSILRQDESDPDTSWLFAFANVTYGGFLAYMPAFLLGRVYASSLGGMRRRLIKAATTTVKSVSSDEVDAPVTPTFGAPLSVNCVRFRVTCV